MLSVYAISAGSGNATFNFGGGTLGALATWSSPLAMNLSGMGGDGTIDTTGGNISLSGNLTGTGGLTKIGLGTLTMTGTNTYSGDTTVDGGTLQVSAGQLSSPIQFVGNSGTGSFVQSGGSNSLGGSGLLYLGNAPGASGSYSLSGGLLSATTEYLGNSGSGSFTQSGGTHAVTNGLYLGANAGSSGTYNLNGGLLSVSAISAGSGNATFNFGGGTLGALAPWSSALAMNLSGIGGNGTVDTTGGNIGLSGNLSGTGGLTKIGSGTLTLSGATSYSGATAVNSGQLALTGNAGLGNTAIRIASGALFTVNPGFGTIAAGLTGPGSSGATLNLAAGGSLNMTGDNAIGIFDLYQQNSFSGPALTLGGGTLSFDLSSSGADSIFVNQGAAALAGTNTISIHGLGPSLIPGSYTVIYDARGGLSNANFVLSSNTLQVGATTYLLTLSGNSNQELLTVGLGQAAFGTITPILAASQMITGGTDGLTFTVTNSRRQHAERLRGSRHQYRRLDADGARSGRQHQPAHQRPGIQQHDYRNWASWGASHCPIRPLPKARKPVIVSVDVLDHAAGSAAATGGNGFLAHAGATGLSATISLSNAPGTRSDLEIDSAPTIGSGTLSGGPAAPYYVSAGSAQAYTATFNAGNTPGPLSNTVTFASAGDKQSLPGASPLELACDFDHRQRLLRQGAVECHHRPLGNQRQLERCGRRRTLRSAGRVGLCHRHRDLRPGRRIGHSRIGHGGRGPGCGRPRAQQPDLQQLQCQLHDLSKAWARRA